MKYLIDTCVISEIVAKQPNERVIEWIDSVDPEQVYLSVVTIGELQKGIERLPTSKRKAALTEWLHDDMFQRFHGHILDLDTEAMLAWGTLTGRLEAAGKPIPTMDSLIAALALHGNFTLVTHNIADFQHTGVPIFNPWTE
jgi:predicted nucleic acid-binding protein